MLTRRFVTVQGAAQYLSVTEEAILAFIKNRELKAANLARSKTAKKPRWRIAADDLDEFLLSRTRSSNAITRKASRKHSASSEVTKYF